MKYRMNVHPPKPHPPQYRAEYDRDYSPAGWSPMRTVLEWHNKWGKDWAGTRWYGTCMYENGICRLFSGKKAMKLGFGIELVSEGEPGWEDASVLP